MESPEFCRQTQYIYLMREISDVRRKATTLPGSMDVLAQRLAKLLILKEDFDERRETRNPFMPQFLHEYRVNEEERKEAADLFEAREAFFKYQRDNDPYLAIYTAANNIPICDENIRKLRREIKQDPEVVRLAAELAGWRKKQRIAKKDPDKVPGGLAGLHLLKSKQEIKRLKKCMKKVQSVQSQNQLLKDLLMKNRVNRSRVKGHEDYIAKARLPENSISLFSAISARS